MSTDQPRAERRRRRLAAAGATLVILAVGVLTYWFFEGRYEVGTNDAYVTGMLEPVEAQTAGTAVQVLVRRTERVYAGEVLGRLQGDRAHLAVRFAAADLDRTVRKVRGRFAKVAALEGQIAAQVSARNEQRENLRRYQESLKSGAVSLIRVEDTRARIRTLAAGIRATRARLRASEALVRSTTVITNPLVRAAIARLEAADIAWQRRIIRAPVSGFVAARSLYPGSQVHVGERLFTIVPLTDLWVVANVKETRMARVRPGQPVHMISDYYGGRVRYRGVVLGLLPGAGSAFSILPPDNATGNYIHIVERVPVRIGLEGAPLQGYPLRPGLSMTVHIDVRRVTGSLWAPLTKTPRADDGTAIYARQLQKAQRLVAGVLREAGACGHSDRRPARGLCLAPVSRASRT